MRKHAVVLVLSFLALAALTVFAGWAVFAGSHLGRGGAGLGTIWPYVLGGALAVGLCTGAFMWLAFYSANHGYDDRVDNEFR